MYRRDDEKSQCRDGVQAGYFSASQGAEPAGFSAQNSSAEVKASCSRAEHVKSSGAEQLKFSGAEQMTTGIPGAEPQLSAALADLEETKVLMARVTASLYAPQFTVGARCGMGHATRDMPIWRDWEVATGSARSIGFCVIWVCISSSSSCSEFILVCRFSSALSCTNSIGTQTFEKKNITGKIFTYP